MMTMMMIMEVNRMKVLLDWYPPLPTVVEKRVLGSDFHFF